LADAKVRPIFGAKWHCIAKPKC